MGSDPFSVFAFASPFDAILKFYGDFDVGANADVKCEQSRRTTHSVTCYCLHLYSCM